MILLPRLPLSLADMQACRESIGFMADVNFFVVSGGKIISNGRVVRNPQFSVIKLCMQLNCIDRFPLLESQLNCKDFVFIICHSVSSCTSTTKLTRKTKLPVLR